MESVLNKIILILGVEYQDQEDDNDNKNVIHQ